MKRKKEKQQRTYIKHNHLHKRKCGQTNYIITNKINRYKRITIQTTVPNCYTICYMQLLLDGCLQQLIQDIIRSTKHTNKPSTHSSHKQWHFNGKSMAPYCVSTFFWCTYYSNECCTQHCVYTSSVNMCHQNTVHQWQHTGNVQPQTYKHL